MAGAEAPSYHRPNEAKSSSLKSGDEALIRDMAQRSVVECCRFRGRFPSFPAAGAEDGRADTDERSPFLDRYFIISAHPHGEPRQRHAELRLQLLAQLAQGHEMRAR